MDTLSALQAYQRAADQATGLQNGDRINIQAKNDNVPGVFGRVLENTLTDTRDAIGQGERMSQLSLTADVPLNQLTAAVNQADLTLRTVVALRDRFISAYQEVMRMQV